MRFGGSEVLAAGGLVFPAFVIAFSYLGGRSGVGLLPVWSVAAATVSAGVIVYVLHRRARWTASDVLLYLAVIAGVSVYLWWLAWPALLPLGSGPDLTHHLVLIDYLERRGHLVDVVSAGPHLGEMSHYTPGLHLLTVIAGILTRSDGFHALYPTIAMSVALKLGLFLLILRRLQRHHALREPLALGGVLLALGTSIYSIHSFTHDSFFAQVVSEFFAIGMWWTLIAWDQQPSRLPMILFAIAGVAAFLTWPVWVGPPIVTLMVLLLLRRDLDAPSKLSHAMVGLAPIVGVAAIHAVGRSGWAVIVGTSGAVLQPSPALLGWWLPVLALAGLVIAARRRAYHVLLFFSAAILTQAVALFIFAKSRGAATPYMAIKMTYLAVYPGVAAAVVALSAAVEAASGTMVPARWMRTWRVQGLAWMIVLVLIALVVRDAQADATPAPIVSPELWAAGRWARDSLPPACVDYLVGNEYTAYWLHLAVLGNSRASARSADNDTYLTQPSVGRWLVPGGLPYAVADLRILPSEIRRDVEVLAQFGPVAIIARPGGSCPQSQDGWG